MFVLIHLVFVDKFVDTGESDEGFLEFPVSATIPAGHV
jgi:hypothetical protein